jgi:RimJ/RimL family protein N-acetyltransferase
MMTSRLSIALVLLVPLFQTGCSTGPVRALASQDALAKDSVAGAIESPTPWFDPSYSPPTSLQTDRILLEPLAARHAELDFAALMGSREHLQRTLHWGDWPSADFTLEENRSDLEDHWKEFEAREGYAFTVLAPDRSRCLGCVYLVPAGRNDRTSRGAQLAYWVIEEQLSEDLDRHLLEQVLAWIEQDWLFDTVAIPLHVENERGAEIARALDLTLKEGAGSPSHLVFVWQR